MHFFYSLSVLLLIAGCCIPNQIISVYQTTDTGIAEKNGIILLSDTPQGLLIRVSLENLPPGPHGFHIHENPSCDPILTKEGTTQRAGSAGGHYDPHKTHQHLGPNNAGHLGDLPVLFVDPDGSVNTSFTLPDLSVNDLKNRSIIIHESGDNYSDFPKPLGGEGNRIACGIIY